VVLDAEFLHDSVGMTVPYPPLFDEIRRNYGYVDLRGRPELAAQVAECRDSPALCALLIKLADSGSPFFTLGCDLGTHYEPDVDACVARVAGGYVQIAGAEYAKLGIDQYQDICHAVETIVRNASSDNAWELRFVHAFTEISIDAPVQSVSSVFIWFFARASSPDDALLSRESLLGALTKALNDPETIAVI
jgi:hypothetical protein